MVYKIEEIEGIGPVFGEKLGQTGISTTDHLLAKCASSSGRKSVAQASGLNESQLLKWANMADLMRISGVGSEYSELLEAAGVDTVKELRNRNAANLAVKMDEANAAKKLTRTVPNEKVLARWIDQAKQLSPIITH